MAKGPKVRRDLAKAIGPGRCNNTLEPQRGVVEHELRRRVTAHASISEPGLLALAELHHTFGAYFRQVGNPHVRFRHPKPKLSPSRIIGE